MGTCAHLCHRYLYVPSTLPTAFSRSFAPSTAAPYQPLARCCLTQSFVKASRPPFLASSSSSPHFLLARVPTPSTSFSFTSERDPSPSAYSRLSESPFWTGQTKDTPGPLALFHAAFTNIKHLALCCLSPAVTQCWCAKKACHFLKSTPKILPPSSHPQQSPSFLVSIISSNVTLPHFLQTLIPIPSTGFLSLMVPQYLALSLACSLPPNTFPPPSVLLFSASDSISPHLFPSPCHSAKEMEPKIPQTIKLPETPQSIGPPFLLS